MSRSSFMRIAPGGSSIPWQVLGEVAGEGDPMKALTSALGERFPCRVPTFHVSGREAMRYAFAHLAARSGRSEIVLPAYCCYSLPASVVAAGLKIRLVDVDEQGRISIDALDDTDLRGVAAIVVANLFGVPEALSPIVVRGRANGVAVIDDAAQTIGGATSEGAVGDRGDVGVLSFGRGKPVSALGGGALLWSRDAEGALPVPVPRPGGAAKAQALLRAIAYDIARHPVVLQLLARIPALEIGTTRYDPGFARGGLPAYSACLAAPLLRRLDSGASALRERAESLARAIRSTSGFAPVLAAAGDLGTYPRLALVAPDPGSRDRALARLVPYGATGMYPESLDALVALAPHVVGRRPCPGARSFARRLITLPTHAGVDDGSRGVIIETLRSASPSAISMGDGPRPEGSRT